MKQIDFLPQRYRDQHVRRRAGLWRLLVCFLVGGTIVAASGAQFAYRAQVQAQLDSVQPLLAQSTAKSQQLAQLQSQLSNVTHQANVCALLQTPVPRTQILAALVKPAPESLEIEELHITRRPIRSNSGSSFRPEIKDAPSDKMLPAAEDADSLTTTLRGARTVVELSGRTDDVAQLHVYVEKLAQSELIAHAELLSTQNASADGAQQRHQFSVEVQIANVFAAEAIPTQGATAPAQGID